MHSGKGKLKKVAVFLLFCIFMGVTAEGLGETAAGSKESVSQEVQVEALLHGMTLEEKVGQLLFVGIAGPEADAETLAQLRELHAGGVVLFDRNMQNPTQVKSLNKK